MQSTYVNMNGGGHDGEMFFFFNYFFLNITKLN